MNTTLNKFVVTFATLALCIALAIIAVPLSHAEDTVQNHPVGLPDGSQGGGITGDDSAAAPQARNHSKVATHDFSVQPQATGVDCATLGTNNDATHINLTDGPTADCETVNYTFELSNNYYHIISSAAIEVTGNDNSASLVVEYNVVNITLKNANLSAIGTEIEGTLFASGERLNLTVTGTNNITTIDVSDLNVVGTGNISLMNSLYITNGNLTVDDFAIFAVRDNINISICDDGVLTCTGDLTIGTNATLMVGRYIYNLGIFRNITNNGTITADADLPYYGTLIDNGTITGTGNYSNDAQAPVIEYAPSVVYNYGQGSGLVTLECAASVSDGGALDYLWTYPNGSTISPDANLYPSGTTSRTLTINSRYDMETNANYGTSAFICNVINTNTTVSGNQTTKSVRYFEYEMNQATLDIKPNDVYIMQNGSVPAASQITHTVNGLVYGHSEADVFSDLQWFYNCTIDPTTISDYSGCIEVNSLNQLNGVYDFNFATADVHVLSENDWWARQATKIPVYRAAKYQGGYFYTSNLAEYQSAVNYGMRLESGPNGEYPAFYATDASTPGSVPIYRSAKLTGDGYFYTVSEDEHATTPANGMRQEGTDFYVMPASSNIYGEIPLYRGAHLTSHGNGNQGYIYTSNWDEYASALPDNGYRQENEVFRVFAG